MIAAPLNYTCCTIAGELNQDLMMIDSLYCVRDYIDGLVSNVFENRIIVSTYVPPISGTEFGTITQTFVLTPNITYHYANGIAVRYKVNLEPSVVKF